MVGALCGAADCRRRSARLGVAIDRTELVDLIEASNLDGLIRFVDRLCANREWDGLVELRDGCREAVQRAKQVWAAAEFAEYRMALEAPGPFAGAVVTEGAGRFSLGPLWEVAASTHSWEDLADHVPSGPMRSMVAHERVVRGEDLTGDGSIDPHVLEIPLRLEQWEPGYLLAVYRSDKADFPEPELPAPAWVELPAPGALAGADAVEEALDQLTRPWVDQSNGRSETVVVAGDALAAVAALGLRRARVAELSPSQALGYMAWTGASGGAYGRRRGTPVGRHDAWWLVAAAADLLDEWPVPADDLGAAAASLEWWRFDPGDQVGGWAFHLAVADPGSGRAWAVSAVDAV